MNSYYEVIGHSFYEKSDIKFNLLDKDKFYNYYYGIEDSYCGLKYFKLKNKINLNYFIDTYSLRIINFHFHKKKKIFNLKIKLNHIREDSKLGNNFIVNLKLFFAFIYVFIFNFK